MAADDFQGSADVLLAKQLEATPVFVINDKEAYGFGIASAFRNVAKAAGVKVVGFTALGSQGRELSGSRDQDPELGRQGDLPRRSRVRERRQADQGPEGGRPERHADRP